MFTYLLLNFLIFIGPLLLSFYPTVNYKGKWLKVFLATLPVAFIFIVWDRFATLRGDWMFVESRTIGLKIYGLPIEEILFFFTVPFSCIFIMSH